MLKEDEIYYVELEDAKKYELFDEEMLPQLYEFTKYPFFRLKKIKKYRTKKIYVWQYMPMLDLFYDFCDHVVKNEKIEKYEEVWKHADDYFIKSKMEEKDLKMKIDLILEKNLKF